LIFWHAITAPCGLDAVAIETMHRVGATME